MICCEWLTIRVVSGFVGSWGAVEVCLEAFSDCVADVTGPVSCLALSLAIFFFFGALR